jgi:hypothetical protein
MSPLVLAFVSAGFHHVVFVILSYFLTNKVLSFCVVVESKLSFILVKNCVLYKSCSFCCDRIQWNFLRQTPASGCEGFLMFQELNPSPTSGCVGGLVTPKLMTRCPTLCCVYLCMSGYGLECNSLVSGKSQNGVALVYSWLCRAFH